MRVANVMLGRGRGGLETMAVRYHEALASTGAGVLSIGRRDSWFAGQLGAAFHGLGNSFLGDFGVAAHLGRVLKAFAPDVVLAHGTRAFRLAKRAGRWRVAFVAHNFRFKPEMAAADLILAASEPVALALRERFPSTPVELVENFGRLEFAPIRTMQGQPFRVGSLGRLHPNKGFDTLIEAASMMRDRHVDFTLEIAGEGEERERLEDLIARHKLADVVRLRGWTDAPATFLAGLDLFVLPSRVEPFGLVLVEAMAAGTPIVATDIDGPGQILGGDLGVLAPAEDSVGLAFAISGALADRLGSRRRAEAAQAEARSRFGLEVGARRLASALSVFDPVERARAA